MHRAADNDIQGSQSVFRLTQKEGVAVSLDAQETVL